MSNLKQATWGKLSFTGKAAADHTAVRDYQKTFAEYYNQQATAKYPNIFSFWFNV